MIRILLLPAVAGLIGSATWAQQTLDPARRIPITVPIKNAGTLNVATGKWTRPGAGVPKASQTVYNNTCTWTNGSYYSGLSECEDFYDEGRVPSADNSFGNPAGLTGTSPSQLLTSIQIGYCVFNDPGPIGPGAGPGINMELAIWNKLRGDCIGNIPVGHGTWTNSSLTDYHLNLAGQGLPGSQTAGTMACWVITLDVTNDGFTLLSDGDGTFDNVGAEDKFIWAARINDQTPGPGPNGFFLSGEPSKGPGSCTYNIACATDPLSPQGAGSPCGSGLDTADTFWINVDAGCTTGTPSGSGCYWFGGYPGGPFASYWLALQGQPLTTAPPVVTSVGPLSGGEGTVLTVTGSGFGPNPDDNKLLLANGIGFADVTAVTSTTLTASIFKVANAGTGPVTVIAGTGSTLSNQNIVAGGITSNSSQVKSLVGGLGTNFGTFTLGPASLNTVGSSVGTPLIAGLDLDLGGLSGATAVFCTSKPSSIPGCVPMLAGSGPSVPKQGGPGTYTITAAPVPGGGGKPAILIYTKNGLVGSPASTPFGFLCLDQFLRAGAFPSPPGGTGGQCDGTYQFDFGAMAPSLNFAVGDTLDIQAWYRDPTNPGTANFTNGIGPIAVSTGDGLDYRLAFKVSSTFFVFQERIDFDGMSTSSQKAEHLAAHVNLSFGGIGVSATFSGSTVQISMTGATYGGIVVANV